MSQWRSTHAAKVSEAGGEHHAGKYNRKTSVQQRGRESPRGSQADAFPRPVGPFAEVCDGTDCCELAMALQRLCSSHLPLTVVTSRREVRGPTHSFVSTSSCLLSRSSSRVCWKLMYPTRNSATKKYISEAVEKLKQKAWRSGQKARHDLAQPLPSSMSATRPKQIPTDGRRNTWTSVTRSSARTPSFRGGSPESLKSS